MTDTTYDGWVRREDVAKLVAAAREVLRCQGGWGDETPFQALADAVVGVERW